MIPFPALSCFPPQLIADLLAVLRGLLRYGQAKAVARLIFAAFQGVRPNSPTFPGSSPRRRHRKRGRKQSPHLDLAGEVVSDQWEQYPNKQV